MQYYTSMNTSNHSWGSRMHTHAQLSQEANALVFVLPQDFRTKSGMESVPPPVHFRMRSPPLIPKITCNTSRKQYLTCLSCVSFTDSSSRQGILMYHVTPTVEFRGRSRSLSSYCWKGMQMTLGSQQRCVQM